MWQSPNHRYPLYLRRMDTSFDRREKRRGCGLGGGLYRSAGGGGVTRNCVCGFGRKRGKEGIDSADCDVAFKGEGKGGVEALVWNGRHCVSVGGRLKLAAKLKLRAK
jgi:hypothetical protein